MILIGCQPKLGISFSAEQTSAGKDSSVLSGRTEFLKSGHRTESRQTCFGVHVLKIWTESGQRTDSRQTESGQTDTGQDFPENPDKNETRTVLSADV